MKRKARGQSLVEFAIAIIVLIPIALILLDGTLVACAIRLNDRTCSEAARLAAIGNPALATARAEQTVESVSRRTSGPLSLKLLDAESNFKKAQLEALSPYGGQINCTVKVSTEVTVHPFILSLLLGLGNTPLHFHANQQFPCTYVMPNVLEHGKI